MATGDQSVKQNADRITLEATAQAVGGRLQVSYALTNHGDRTLIAYDGAGGVGGPDYPDLTGGCYVSFTGRGVVRLLRIRPRPHPTMDTTRILMPAVSVISPGQTRRVAFALPLPLKEHSEWSPDFAGAKYKSQTADRVELAIDYFWKASSTELKPLGEPNVWQVRSGASLSEVHQVSQSFPVTIDVIVRTDDTFVRM